MPEYPDIEVYLAALQRFLGGKPLQEISLKSPFLLRSVAPPLQSCEGLAPRAFTRIGKRIVWHFESGPLLVFHLMVTGRFHWKSKRVEPKRKNELCAFHFEHGTMMLTEAGTKKRASLHVVAEESDLAAFDRGGLEVFETDLEGFGERLCCENHTLKRALSDPRLFSAIGNAFSDEILHAARLSPVKLTSRLEPEEIERLFQATRERLTHFKELYTRDLGDAFPEKVTAFHPKMAVHGRFGEECPTCGTKVQRIVYADRETNYCPRCQTGGKLLADRALSKLLKGDWPRTIEELEG